MGCGGREISQEFCSNGRASMFMLAKNRTNKSYSGCKRLEVSRFLRKRAALFFSFVFACVCEFVPFRGSKEQMKAPPRPMEGSTSNETHVPKSQSASPSNPRQCPARHLSANDGCAQVPCEHGSLKGHGTVKPLCVCVCVCAGEIQ